MPDETDNFRRAKYENADMEELQARVEQATPHRLGLPTQWRNMDRSVDIPGPNAAVVPATQEEVRQFVDDAPRATCGACKFFNNTSGRQAMIDQRFAERVVNEQEWQLKHLFVTPPEHVGVCDASGGELATTMVSKCCDQFRERGGRGGRWRL